MKIISDILSTLFYSELGKSDTSLDELFKEYCSVTQKASAIELKMARREKRKPVIPDGYTFEEFEVALGACVDVGLVELTPDGDYKMTPKGNISFSKLAARLYGLYEKRFGGGSLDYIHEISKSIPEPEIN
jgi:hypothetical protein